MSCTTSVNFDRYDRPGLILTEAMGVGRRLADRLDDGCGGALHPRGTLLPKTVSTFARGRDLINPRFAGPLEGLIALLDAKIEAGAVERVEPVVVGSDENGLIYGEQRVRDAPEALRPLVEARDLARRLSDLVEEVRDIVAADVAVMRMRQEAVGK